MKTHTLHVTGMHCASCPILIESELNDIPEVSRAKASLKNQSIEIMGDFGDQTAERIARNLSETLKRHGYTVSTERQRHSAQWDEFLHAVPFAAAFIALFILLQKLDIVNLITTTDVTYGTAFLIGVIASISTCMAVVGGLVLSVSAKFAKDGDAVKPQTLFHVGRLVSFFVLGGTIGLLGATFELGATGTFVMSLLVAFALLILGINLLDVFRWTKKLQPTLPSFFAGYVGKLKNANHTLTPLLLGVATFFLPCGFTQSMQIYTLTTGSFWSGALTMSAFALGTLPVLALLSFSSLAVHTKARSGVFFKTAGLVVIFFGLLNLTSSLAAAGIINPLFNF